MPVIASDTNSGNSGFFLQAFSSPDLGLLVNGIDFAITQEMSEEFRQEVNYINGFGVDGPIARSLRYSDDGTISFTAVLLKGDTATRLKTEDDLKFLRDFEIVTQKGNDNMHTYSGCNWTSLTVRSTQDGVMLDATLSIPGLARQSQ